MIRLIIACVLIHFSCRYVKDPSLLVVPNGGPGGGHVTGSSTRWRRTGSDGAIGAPPRGDQLLTPEIQVTEN